MSRYLRAALLVLLLAPLPLPAAGQSLPQLSWKVGSDAALQIDVFGALSAQQRKLIASGLSTFSHFEIQSRDRDGRTSLLFVAECTLKYDLWEEKYELQQLAEVSQPPQTLADYGQLCFRAQLSSAPSLRRILDPGSSLVVELTIAQVSAAFAADVRRWLIEQQSGVMRGLFAHMLGELQLSENARFMLEVPSLDAKQSLQVKERLK